MSHPDANRCSDFRDDYLECLHHKREFRRANAIADEEGRQRADEVERLKEKAERVIGDASTVDVLLGRTKREDE